MPGCGCGNPAVDRILGHLPDDLSPSLFNHLLFEAPKVYDEEIRVQADKSDSIFTSLLTSRTFPADQTEYSEIRVTRSAGLQFYDNNEVFRKAYSPDHCVPGCVWSPKTFDAGRQIVSSHLKVADFEQEVPCIDNMLKKYAFVDFFLTIPDFLKGYMEDVSNQYIRNELLTRAKKVILTNEQTRASTADPRAFPNMLNTNNAVQLLSDLTPMVLSTFYDELMAQHPDCKGFEESGGYNILGLMIDPMQWRLKQITGNVFGDYIARNPDLNSQFFKKFHVTELFAEMFAILPTRELPRADVDPLTGDVLYHHRYIDVPTGSGGVIREGNPGFNEAEFGVALVLNSELGFLWDEQPLPVTQIGDAKFGPQFGQIDLPNQKWRYLNAYDYDDNPLGKGGKWIAQYKTGMHPGPGIKCLYAILYPLTKYVNVKQGLPEGECFTSPAACPDLFQDLGCPCPFVKFCCNISELQAVIKTDLDLGIIVTNTFEVIYEDGSQQTLTADEIIQENGLFIYRVSSATPIRCNCIRDFVCAPVTTVCSSQVLSNSDARHTLGQHGLQLESCFDAPALTSLTLTHANGVEVVTPVITILPMFVGDTEIDYHFVARTVEQLAANGPIVLVELAGVVECPDINAVIDCAPIP